MKYFCDGGHDLIEEIMTALLFERVRISGTLNCSFVVVERILSEKD